MGCLNSKLNLKVHSETIQPKQELARLSNLSSNTPSSTDHFPRTVNTVLVSSQMKPNPYTFNCISFPSPKTVKTQSIQEINTQLIPDANTKSTPILHIFNHLHENPSKSNTKNKTIIRGPLNRNLLEDSPLSLEKPSAIQVWKSNTKLIPNSRKLNYDLKFFDDKKENLKKTDTCVKRKLENGEVYVNQYKILEILGSGPYGKVLKAVGEDCVVALKVIDKRILRTRWIGKGKNAVWQAENEFRMMERLKHKNLLRILEIIEEDGADKIYIVQEYMDKGSLCDAVPVNEKVARIYFKDILEGVEYLHETAKIVHRDLKPQNFFINSSGAVKICGLGSAEAINNTSDICGTYAFLPPEAYTSKVCTPAGDIWALGISLYYMITGKIPYFSKKSADLEYEVKNREIALPDSFSSDLKSLLTGMFQKNPENRLNLQQVKYSTWVQAVFVSI